MSLESSHPTLDHLTTQYAAIQNLQEKRTFYSQYLYPALRDSFVAQPAADPPIVILLLPVSNPYVPVLATARWKPALAFAIYSSRSIEHRAFIEAEIAALESNIICDGRAVSNIEIQPENLYHAIRDIIQPYLHAERDNKHIAVDITGGTSVMSVGAAMAVSLVGGRFFYILSGATKDDITNRAVGTEQPRRLDDPYTVFGDLEAREAQRLFAKHDYAGAKRIFATLAQRVPAPDNAPYRAYTLLADAYAKWDVFDWAAAATALKTLLDDTASLRDDLEPECARLQAQHDALQQLQNDNAQWKKKPPLTLLADLQSILPLLGSLYANAKRREAQKRYDVAALFHYRCLELISQHRLAAWGILTERPDYTAVQQHGIRARELDARYRQVEHTLFPRERGLPYAGQPISLFNGYMLLAALDDPLVHTFSIKQIRERTDARNKSMLAHGFRLITETEYQAFYGVVDELLTRFFTVSAQDRSAWEQRYQFVCPFATRPES